MKTRQRTYRGFLAACAVLALTVSGLSAIARTQAGEPARLTFIKKFPGSQPEYIHVQVKENGEAVYQGGTIAEPEEPESFQLSDKTTAELFRLAAELEYFLGLTLDVSKPVARMGEKTFVYEKGPDRREVKFNFTHNESGKDLQQLFENIARGRHLLWELDYRARFDRLGVPEVLRQFDAALTDGKLVDEEEFIPILEKVADNARLMKLARSHARRLIERIENQSARLQLESGDLTANQYVSLVVRESGKGTFDLRRFDQKPQPRPLKLPPALQARFWELVELSNNFQREEEVLEHATRFSGYRMTYEKGRVRKQLFFTVPPSAVVAELIHILNRVMVQEQFLAKLQDTMTNNRFMVQVVLQDLDTALKRSAIADPGVFASLLEGIAKEESRHEIERNLARQMLQRIRSARPSQAFEAEPIRQ